MNKLIGLILLCFLVFSCRTKQKIVDKTVVEHQEIIKVDSVVQEDKKIEEEVKVKEVKKEDKEDKTTTGDIEIKGKAEESKPFVYHNVNNGDTLQSITISGNADFVIKNKWNNSKVNESSSIFKESINKVAEYSRKAVAKETIKKTAIKITDKKKEVKESGFDFITWLFLFLLILVIIVLAYFRFRNKITTFFK